MKKQNNDLFSEIMQITGRWIWYLFKFLLTMIFLITKGSEWLLSAFNALLMNMIKINED